MKPILFSLAMMPLVLTGCSTYVGDSPGYGPGYYGGPTVGVAYYVQLTILDTIQIIITRIRTITTPLPIITMRIPATEITARTKAIITRVMAAAIRVEATALRSTPERPTFIDTLIRSNN